MATAFRRAAGHRRNHYYRQPPPQNNNSICVFWVQGRCNRNPCRFLHAQTFVNSKIVPTQDFDTPKLKVCDHWISNCCVYGDKCRFLHSWLHSDGDAGVNNPSMLARLSGHKKGVMGISLPSGSNRLFSGSKEGTVRVWDCNSGECVRVIDNGAEIGCLIGAGSWVFIGLSNVVKAWRVDVSSGDYEEFVLDGPVGQVNSMVACDDFLFAGAEDGVIIVWKGSFEVNPFKLVSTMKAHTGPVLSLSFGMQNKRLFSSSMDHTIKVWNLKSYECIQTLDGHSDAVKSLLCWDEYLFSCSLDKTIKVWGDTAQLGSLELMYTHEEQCGVVALSGMFDAEAKPILFVSCKDSAVRLYELPSFKERIRLFSRKEVDAIQMGPGGLFFLGDGSGAVSVWNWVQQKSKNVLVSE